MKGKKKLSRNGNICEKIYFEKIRLFQTAWWDRRETEASGARRIVSWYIKLICFPTEASLFRPIEFACPPGIHVLLLISGIRALFFRIGDSEPRELSTPKVGARGGTDAVRSGMRYVGTFGTFLTAVLVGLSLTFG